MGVGTNGLDTLRDAFAALSRALKRISVYRHTPDQHASYVAPALSMFREVVEREGSVTVEVQPTALVCEGTPVHTEQPREWGLCFRLHRDGVRSLTFRRGLLLEELLTLCNVALYDPHGGPGREDAVTELWKADLSGITYQALAGYRMEHGEVDALAVAAAVGRITERTRPVLAAIDPNRSAFAEETAIDAKGTLLPRQKLEELDPQRWQDLAQRSALTLVRIVEQGFAGRDLEALEESFWRLLDELIDRREATALARALEALRKMGGLHAPDFRAAVGRRLGDGLRLQRMAELAGLSDRALTLALPVWLALLPREAGIQLLEVLSHAPAAAQPQLARAAIERADASLEKLGQALSTGTPGAALALLGALDGLSPATRAELAAPALHHPSSRVRIEAVAAVGAEPDLAVQLLGRLLRAPEPSVRTAVAFTLSSCTGVAEQVGKLLADVIDTDEFDARDPEEQLAFHKALGRVGSTVGFDFLVLRLSENRGLFRKRPAEEERLLAVAGLTEELSMRSVRALEAAAARPDQPPVVAAAARASLAKMQRPQGRGRSSAG